MKRKAILSALLIALIMLGLTGMPVRAQGANPTIILRVGTGDSGEGLAPHQALIEQFEKANPDILIQLEPVAGGDYYQRLLVQIAAKAAPDLMQIGDDAVPLFADRNALTPLDEFLTGKYPLDPKIYLPGIYDLGKYKGKQYLLPKDFSPLGVYYNKKLFDAAKVPYPQPDWTWDDLLKTAQALTKDGQWGIQLPASWTTGFEYWPAAAGGSLISPDGKSFVGFMDSPETISAVQFYADLYNKYKVAPPPADFSLWGGGNSEFDNGKAAMRLFGRWPEAGMLKNPNIDLGLVGLPKGKVRANVLFWGGFGISSTSQNKEAAWRFLRFYVGEEAGDVWRNWGLPTIAKTANDMAAKNPIEAAWINELKYLAPRAYTFTPYWNQAANDPLAKALQEVISKPDAKVEAVMKKAAADAQKLLTDAQRQ